ncbi:MAG TPA: penicillin-binding protein activator [Gammaproteobacteria bacterium]
MRPALPVILIGALLALLAGCAAGPEATPAAEERKEVERRALSLRDEGRFREAAQAYLSLARTSDAPLSHEFVLSAAMALIEEGDIAASRKLLDEVLPAELDPVLEIRRKTLRAEIALVEQRPYDALALLPHTLKATAPPSLRYRIGNLRARALHDAGQYMASIQERIGMEPALTDPANLAQNHRRLWASVSRLSPAELGELRSRAPDMLRGWLELGIIASNLMFDPETLDREIALWQSRFPGHPAIAEIAPTLAELAREGALPPSKVVLLLPLKGDFGGAATAIRDGFLSAWFSDDSNARRPEVVVRAVNNGEVWPAYQDAVADGAGFVVGPLERTAVDEIAAAGTLPVPTLALNYVSAPARPAAQAETAAAANGYTVGLTPVTGEPAPPALPDLLYQFSLSPEDEARAVAKRAWFDGRARAGLITPVGQWGNRVVSAFTSEFERLGGQVVEVQHFASDAVDMSGTIKALLNVDASEERRRQLVRTLGRRVEFEPQRRNDLDLVFMAAFPVQARQLSPLLRFHHAEDVPVYSTSHIYTGMPDPAADIDVDGVMFPDMPWTLSAYESTGLRRTVIATWPEAMPTYLRLYAFGTDAYRLVSRLRALKAQPYAEYEGATGFLSVDDRNRVERRLLWAQFADGLPRVMENP